MVAEYQLWLSDASGNRLGVIPGDQIVSLKYALVTNDAGALTLDVPRSALPDPSTWSDARIEVRRRPPGGAWQLEGSCFWLVHKEVRGVTRDRSYRRLTALTTTSLLDRRCTMWYAGSSQVAVTSDYADDMMKDIVRNNLGATANNAPVYSAGTTPSRDWSSLITVIADASLGPTISKEFAWRNVLSVLQDIAGDSAKANNPVYFGIVMSGAALVFRTWVGQPGRDLTTGINKLTVSAERGSLGGTVEVTEDWSDVATWVVAGGQGQQSARTLGASYNIAQGSLTPFGVREAFINATQLTSTAALNGEAAAELWRRRPRRVLTGQIVSVPGALYGVDWNWGDRVLAQFESQSFSALVEKVTVKLEKGEETVEARITGNTA